MQNGRFRVPPGLQFLDIKVSPCTNSVAVCMVCLMVQREHFHALTHTATSRLTTSHCAQSRWWSIMNIQNCRVHHLIRKNLHCAPPKCTPVKTTLCPLICMYVMNHHMTILYIRSMTILSVRVLVHHLSIHICGAQHSLVVRTIVLYL